MRKYQQLILIIVSIISIVSLVQYRNEYLRLRYVLQVLNFFGSPNSIIDNNCISLNESFVNSEHNFYKYSDPSPIWYNFEGYFLYSAFWEIKDADNGKRAVKILAVGPESSFQNYKCRIWFDEGEDTLFLFSPLLSNRHYSKRIHCVLTLGLPRNLIMTVKKHVILLCANLMLRILR